MRELDRQIKENGSKQELACGLGGGRRQLGRNRGREGVGRSSRRGDQGGRGGCTGLAGGQGADRTGPFLSRRVT